MPIRVRAIVFAALAIVGCKVAREAEGPVARQGVIDLSRWDFEARGPVSLEGEWMFRYGELLGPGALKQDQPPAPPMIQVPRPWNDVAVDGKPLAGQGVATRGIPPVDGHRGGRRARGRAGVI